MKYPQNIIFWETSQESTYLELMKVDLILA